MKAYEYKLRPLKAIPQHQSVTLIKWKTKSYTYKQTNKKTRNNSAVKITHPLKRTGRRGP